MAGGIPRAPAMQHAAVVPHDGVPLLPPVLEHVLGTGGVGVQLVEQPPRLVERYPLDVPGVRADVDRLLAVDRIRAHERLAHRRQAALVLGIEQALRDRAARIEDAVDDHAALEPAPRLLGEGGVGVAHADELGLAADGRDLAPREQ